MNKLLKSDEDDKDDAFSKIFGAGDLAGLEKELSKQARELADLLKAAKDTDAGRAVEALLYAASRAEGRALTAIGDIREAARRFLDTYANYPEAEAAPEALWRLGAALGELGSLNEACVTLGEVSTRYPGTPAVSEAQAESERLGCQ